MTTPATTKATTGRWLLVFVTLGLSFLVSSTKAADDRLWLHATINGTPARLCFDTGFESVALTSDAAKRFGLKATNAPLHEGAASGKIMLWMTEKCLLDIEGIAGKTAFRVIDLPASEPWDFDGMIGWPPFKGNVLRIYASSGVLTFPHEVEEQLPGWTRVSIATNSDTLNLEISYAKGSRGLILIDTGNDMGVMLPPRKWQAWKKAHPHCPMTLRAIFRPADGYIAQEESWASNFGLGPLVITDVPVAEDAPSVESVFGAEYEGTFGLSALKRLDLIVDGKRGVAHLRTKTTAAGPYQHNRAGVAFLPSRGTSEVLVAARVLEGSPAWEAGVRSGDILLKCDGKAVSPLSPGEKGRLEGTPGTKLVLTLKRGRKTFDTMVTLRQMLPSAY